MNSRVRCLLGLLLVFTSPAVPRLDAAARPNILIVTADNLGYGDLRCFDPGSAIQTPNLDRLASEGAKLTDFYTPSSTCTVSRACLLTGRIPARHGLTIQLPGVEGNYGRGLNPAEVLIPQVLRTADYATGCFGKWNLGFAPGSRPTERGFDEFFGHASGNMDYYSHKYNGIHDLYRGIAEAHVDGYASDLFADAAIDFIHRHRDAPWFVYLPFNAPHFPNARNKATGQENIWQAPAYAFEAYGYDPNTRDEQQRYRAVVTALDRAIGRVLDSLDELGLSDNTFVFFYSDNGAFMLSKRGLEVASNAPLRDGGVTCWEGGVRVAALARWPGRIQAASVIREPLWSPDLLVACARLAGADLAAERKIDGLNPLPVLTGRSASPHRSLYFTYGEHAGLRMGDWKIVRTATSEPWKLFRLTRDIGETKDLATQHPNRLAELVEDFQRWEQASRQQQASASTPEASGVGHADPIRSILAPDLRSTVDVVLENYRTKRKYPDDRFPMPSGPFETFRQEGVSKLSETLGLQQWLVRQPLSKRSPIANRFRDRMLKQIEHHAVRMEVHAVEFPDSGLTVPMILCLPEGTDEKPGVCVFSGHTPHGLRDLVLDLDSYQQGVAVRLAKAGFVTIAVEKIDAGYLSRDGSRGVDENELATTLLHWGRVLRTHQLKACLAASEILATHPRVDPSRIGATGVSLGGWLSVQTALLSDRIAAVADFGRKTLTIAPEQASESFAGPSDLCHILPGMLSLCDRNVLALAYAPRPLLAGHGRQDEGSHRQGPIHFEQLFRRQYEALGAVEQFDYHVHDGGDTMPFDVVTDWFQNALARRNP